MYQEGILENDLLPGKAATVLVHVDDRPTSERLEEVTCWILPADAKRMIPAGARVLVAQCGSRLRIVEASHFVSLERVSAPFVSTVACAHGRLVVGMRTIGQRPDGSLCIGPEEGVTDGRR